MNKIIKSSAPGQLCAQRPVQNSNCAEQTEAGFKPTLSKSDTQWADGRRHKPNCFPLIFFNADDVLS